MKAKVGNSQHYQIHTVCYYAITSPRGVTGRGKQHVNEFLNYFFSHSYSTRYCHRMWWRWSQAWVLIQFLRSKRLFLFFLFYLLGRSYREKCFSSSSRNFIFIVTSGRLTVGGIFRWGLVRHVIIFSRQDFSINVRTWSRI